MMTRVGLVADTHGCLDPKVGERLRGCALVAHAGDVGGDAVLHALAAASPDVRAVAGNNDVAAKWVGDDLRLLEALPSVQHIHLPGGLLVVVHGHTVLPAKRRHAKLRQMFPDARAIVYGHSHRQVVDTNAEPWILNPGAAGRARTYGGPCYLLLHAAGEKWHVESFQLPPPGHSGGG